MKSSQMGDAGAQILDVRDAAEYAKGHLAGSINIGLGGQYATWAGTVLDRSKPIVIIAEPGREQEAAFASAVSVSIMSKVIWTEAWKRLPSARTWCGPPSASPPPWWRTN